MIRKKITLFTFSFLLVFAYCKGKSSYNQFHAKKKFGIFKVINETTVEMNGEIGSRSLKRFERLIEQYPNIKKINIRAVPGSKDDVINLQLSLLVHEKGISTHVMDDGLIASGGVDFFLAGIKRTLGKSVRIGVHSWSGPGIIGSHLPENAPEHKLFIDYYVQIGFTPDQANAFYFFTIHAASPHSIHFMTPEEIEVYDILKN